MRYFPTEASRDPPDQHYQSLLSVSPCRLARTHWLASHRIPLPLQQVPRTHTAWGKYHRLLVGKQALSVYPACRVTLHQVTSLLAQFDYFTEKSTFIQNSLLPLYIDKKSKNRKTVTLFFLNFLDRVTKNMQPDGEHQNFIMKSYHCWCRSFSLLLLGKLIPIFAFLTLGFYIYKYLIKI